MTHNALQVYKREFCSRWNLKHLLNLLERVLTKRNCKRWFPKIRNQNFKLKEKDQPGRLVKFDSLWRQFNKIFQY